MPTVGQQLLQLRDEYLKEFSTAEKNLKEAIFEKAYESVVLKEKKDRYKKLFDDIAHGLALSDKEKAEMSELKEFLEKEEIQTLHGALKHVFDITFATFGRDTIMQEDNLTNEQKTWLAYCYQNLKADLLAMHQRITLQALQNNNFDLPEIVPGEPEQEMQNTLLQRLTQLRQEEGLAKKIQETLELQWVQAAAKIDEIIAKINPPAPQPPVNLQNIGFQPQQPNIGVIPQPLQPNVVVVPQPQQVNVVVMQPEPQPASYSSGSSLGFYTSGYYHPHHHYYGGFGHYHHQHHHHGFLWSNGWGHAHHHYGNYGLYSHHHSNVDFELLRCCKNLCIEDFYFKLKVLGQCDSCGKFNCSSCSPVSCSNCHCFQCVCDGLIDGVSKAATAIGDCCGKIDCSGCCNSIGSGVSWVASNIGELCGRMSCDCCSSLCSSVCGICRDINCSGCSLPDCSNVCDICRGMDCSCKFDDCGDAGKVIVGGCTAFFVGIFKAISSCCGGKNDDSDNTADYSSSSTGAAGPSGLSYHHNFKFSAEDALGSTGVAAAASSSSPAHTQYLTSTASQVAGTVAYFGLAGPHIARAAFVPCMNIYHGYKIKQSIREIVGAVLSGLTCFLACYFPVFGGPNAAAVFGGGGFVGGSLAAKRYNHSENRKIFNGETNPEKWLLTSEVLAAFGQMGVAPQDLVQLIFTLRDIKSHGASKTNNQGWGAYRLLRFLGYLVDYLKDPQELIPDDILKLLREKNPEAFGLMRNRLGLLPPAPVQQTMPAPIASAQPQPYVPNNYYDGPPPYASAHYQDAPLEQKMGDEAVEVVVDDMDIAQPYKYPPPLPYDPQIASRPPVYGEEEHKQPGMRR